MSTRLFWGYREPMKNELPISLKWHLEDKGLSQIPSVDWLEGYIAAYDDTKKEEIASLKSLLNAMAEGHEIELQWR